MTHYDWWIQQGPGGPYDEEPIISDEYEEAKMNFHSLVNPYTIAKARRMQKRSTARRRNNPAWSRRQRREDQNAQVLY